MDRAEATGFGIAFAGHAALLAALALGFASVNMPAPKSEPIEVSLVDEVALVSASPTPSREAPAPQLGEIEGPAEPTPPPAPAPMPEPVPLPQVQPQPQPRVQPKAAPAAPAPTPRPVPRPQPKATPPAPKAAPSRPAPKAAPAQPSAKSSAPTNRPQPKAAPRPTGNLKGLLNGVGDAPSQSKSTTPPAALSGQAQASINQVIQRALIPCERQTLPVPEARQIKVQVEVNLDRNGGLSSARVLRVINTNPDLKLYEQRMRDLALSVIQQCTPIRELAARYAEYYAVPRGWKRFNYTFPRN